MNFKFNRNNNILEVTLKNLVDENAPLIQFPKLTLNKTFVPIVEKILNGEKACSDYEAIFIDEMTLEESLFHTIASNSTYKMTGSALMLDGADIHCFDLVFGKVSIEKIGRKKADGDKLHLKNVKIKLYPDGEYKAFQTSELKQAETRHRDVSVSTGENVLNFRGL